MEAQCDVSPVIELGKGVFDLVPRLVQVFVVVDFPPSSAASGTAGLDFIRFEIVPEPVGVVAAVADKTLGFQTNSPAQPLVAVVVAGVAAGQVHEDGSSVRVRKRVCLGSKPACASSDVALAPNSRRHARRGAAGIQVGRIDHHNFRFGLPSDQEGMDPAPDPVPGMASEHVAGSLVVAVRRRHVRLAASGLQDMKHAVQRFLQVDSLHSPHLGQEGLDQFDVLVGRFEDARHGGFSFAFAGTLASQAWFAREEHPVF